MYKDRVGETRIVEKEGRIGEDKGKRRVGGWGIG